MLLLLLLDLGSTGNELIQQYKIYLRSHGEVPASTRGTERECRSTENAIVIQQILSKFPTKVIIKLQSFN